jgi:hypothetical protein
MIISEEFTTDTGEAARRFGPMGEFFNPSEHSKRNCRRCHGRGTESWDSGHRPRWESVNGQIVWRREVVGKRVVACDCVLRRLNKKQNNEDE